MSRKIGKRLLEDDAGQGVVEYGLTTALVSAMVGLQAFGGKIGAAFGGIAHFLHLS